MRTTLLLSLSKLLTTVGHAALRAGSTTASKAYVQPQLVWPKLDH